VPWDGCDGEKIVEFQVNTHVGSNKKMPAVTVFEDGGFVVAWTSTFQDGDGYGVFRQRYEPGGSAAGQEFQVNASTLGDQTAPSVVAFEDGRFLVVWQSSAGPSGIVGQFFDPNGATDGSELQISGSSVYDGTAVTRLTDGTFVVTWSEPDQSGSGVFARRLGTDGSFITEAFQVNTIFQGAQGFPGIAAMAEGTFAVAWLGTVQLGPNSYGDATFAQSFGQDNTKQGPEYLLSTQVPVDDNGGVSIGSSITGDALVAWAANGIDGSGSGIVAQRLDTVGAPLENNFQVNTYADGNQWAPHAAAFPDDGFVVVWEGPIQQAGSGHDIGGQRLAADGTKLGDQFSANSLYVMGDQHNPVAGTFADGSFIVVWSGPTDPGLQYDNGIFAQRFNPDGTKKYH